MQEGAMAIPASFNDYGFCFYIKGVVMNVNEHGGYKIGTKVGQINGYTARNL
jgi:hypothetical protein